MIKWEKWSLYNINFHYNFRLSYANTLDGIPLNRFHKGDGKQPLQPTVDIVGKFRSTEWSTDSDYIFVPHDWVNICNNYPYINYLNNLSKTTPLIILNMGDKTPRCELDNTIEIRTFLHPWENSFRKVIVPYPVESRNFIVRNYKEVPSISFMGYVPKLSFGSLFGRDVRALRRPISSSVFLTRHLSLKQLSNLDSNKIHVSITKRNKFTPIAGNSNLNKHLSEFQIDLNKSDYILCPRGFANISMRFYETLSGGARPILIDTKSVLPFISSSMNWDHHIIQVSQFENWENNILHDWVEINSNDVYKNKQIKNRELFQDYLYFPNYIFKLFQNYLY